MPVVAGYHGDDQSLAALQAAADRIGYPVLVKASAGGGGRGMRVVGQPDELAEAVAGAQREAAAAFGNDQLLIEKYIGRPRHIEVQVFGDTHGNVVSLFERECTLQRRHQKVVEEALSIGVTPERRAGMAAAARAAAQAAGYVNAGTVEFIADAAGFHFIEMNTRLQVEHPVTEMITGLDLVEWQLRVAFGEKLPLRQDAIKANGHAIEARIYAEDADKGFLPSIGRITRWREPPSRDGIRIDTGFRAGDTVTPYYDALLAKLIAWGEDRTQALDRLTEAVGELDIAGVITNIDFLKALLRDPQVRSGEIDTGFIERELAALTAAARALPAQDLAAASAAVLLRERDERAPDADAPVLAVEPDRRLDGRRPPRPPAELSPRNGTARRRGLVRARRVADGIRRHQRPAALRCARRRPIRRRAGRHEGDRIGDLDGPRPRADDAARAPVPALDRSVPRPGGAGRCREPHRRADARDGGAHPGRGRQRRGARHSADRDRGDEDGAHAAGARRRPSEGAQMRGRRGRAGRGGAGGFRDRANSEWRIANREGSTLALPYSLSPFATRYFLFATRFARNQQWTPRFSSPARARPD